MTYRADSPSTFPWGEVEKAGYSYFTGSVSLDSSYPSGGYSLPDNLKFTTRFKTFKGVIFETKSGYMLWYDEDNNKIRVYFGALLEAGVGGDLSAVSGVRFIAWGYR